MSNVKISNFSEQNDLSLIEGIAGYQGTASKSNIRISGNNLKLWLQNNLDFVSGSGTANRIPKFTSTTGLVDSNIIDDGSNIGIFSAVDTDALIQVRGVSSTEKYGLRVNGESSITSGVQGFGAAISAGVNFAPTVDIDDPRYGLRSKATGGMRYPYGIFGEAFNGIEAVGGHFKATGASSDLYSLRLEDGTEGTDKFLKCVTSDGKANWATVPQGVASISIGTGVISTGGLLTVNTVNEVATLTPHYYGGGSNVGYVPTGGDNTKFLRGDGAWAAPTGTTPNIEAVLNASTTGSRPYYGGENCIYLGAQNALGVSYPLTSSSQGRLVLANSAGTAFREFDLNGSYSALGSWVHTGTYFGWNASHVAAWSPGSGFPAIELKNGRANSPSSDASTVRIAALGTATGAQLLLESAKDFVFKLPSAPTTGQVLAAIDSSGKVAWANNGSSYTLPAAAKDTLGGLSLKYDAETSAVTFESLQTASSRFYAINLDSNDHAYVNVPWTDNNDNTTYAISATQTSGTNLNPNLTLTGSNPSSTDDVQFIGDIITVTKNVNDSITWSIPSFSGGVNIGAVPTASAAPAGSFLKNDGTWAVPSGAGTVTQVNAASPFGIAGFSMSILNPTTTPTINLATVNGSAGEYLNHTGDWSTPPNTTYTAGQGISIVGTTISVSSTGTVLVDDIKVDGKIINGTGVDLDIDSTEDIKIDAAKDIDVTAVGNTTGVTVNTDKAVTVNSKEAISLDVKNTATTSTPVNVQPRRGGALVVHGDTTGGGAHDGSITLNCSQDSHGVTIKSPPHSAAATYTLVLPVDEGENGKVLQTDGSGNTSWVAQANTTYAISSVTDGSNVDILLTAGTGGTNSTVQLTAGTGISLSQTGGNNVEIAASGGSGGGFPSAVTASSTAATSAAVDTLYTITTTSGVADIVVTLPTAASNSAKIIGVKYAAQNSVNDTVVIKTISSQTIDGTNRTTNGLPLASVGTYFELVSDGSNWWIK